MPGLAAKPIVDIDVLLTGAAHLPEAINRLARLDYEHQGDLGIPDREAFRSPHDTPAHNLYVCPPHSREFQRHVAFRDRQRTHPDSAAAYAELKRRLAADFRDNGDAYTDGKTAFIRSLIGEPLTSPQ